MPTTAMPGTHYWLAVSQAGVKACLRSISAILTISARVMRHQLCCGSLPILTTPISAIPSATQYREDGERCMGGGVRYRLQQHRGRWQRQRHRGGGAVYRQCADRRIAQETQH